MFSGKRGKVANWLPNQVAYGMDTSDPNPENWKPFGTHAEKIAEEKAKTAKPKPVEG